MFYWYSLLIIFRYQARTSMHPVNVATKDNECWSKKKAPLNGCSGKVSRSSAFI